MPKPKPPLVRLSDLAPGQSGDFFVLLAEKVRGARRDGKPYFTCRFRDSGRTATFMVWSDGPWYESCEGEWQEGQFYKVRGRYEEHPTYGPQIDVQNLRPIQDSDREDFDPLQFVESSRFDPAKMFAELRGLAETEIADVPLRTLILLLLDRHAEALQRLPATQKHFFPFAGG